MSRRHHRARPDDASIADRHAGTEDGASADPAIIADRHRPPEFEPGTPLIGVDRVHRGVDLHVRSEHHVCADRHVADIENDAVVVGIQVLACANVRAVITIERRFDPQVRRAVWKEFPEHCACGIPVGAAERIHLSAQLLGAASSLR